MLLRCEVPKRYDGADSLRESYCSPSHERIVPFSRGEVLGRPTLALLPAPGMARLVFNVLRRQRNRVPQRR